MMNKIFGVKNITHLLYGFLICMPMLSILARTCYVAVNKNAKDSYSSNYVEKFTEVNSTSMFVQNNQFQVNYVDATGNSAAFNILNTNFYDYYNTNNRTITTIHFISQDYGRINLTYSNGDTARIDNWDNYTKTFTFTLDSSSYNLSGPISHVKLYLITYQEDSLDNAFEYSLSQFTKDNNLGNVDIFSWFTNLFLDQTNPTNQLYLGFVNWYLNYTLLVSSGYLLFLTLIWFVNYVRRILDKSMNQEYGGF